MIFKSINDLNRLPELEKQMKDSESIHGVWFVVNEQDIEPEHWYDFVSEDGVVGQCRKRKDGTWLQDPRGLNPVVLAYYGSFKNKKALSKKLKNKIKDIEIARNQ